MALGRCWSRWLFGLFMVPVVTFDPGPSDQEWRQALAEFEAAIEGLQRATGTFSQVGKDTT